MEQILEATGFGDQLVKNEIVGVWVCVVDCSSRFSGLCER